jgi:hypothetical protein
MFGQAPGDEAVIENQSGRAMDRVRIEAAGTELPALDSISVGDHAVVPFTAAHDGAFHLRWVPRGTDVDKDWTGGEITAGPVHSRHHLQVGPDGGVVVTSETISAPGKKSD